MRGGLGRILFFLGSVICRNVLGFRDCDLAMSPASGAVLAIGAAIAGTFIYFGMIGGLAYSIGQAVNAPPRPDKVDRTRRTDAT